MSKTNEDTVLQSRRILQTLMYDGGKFEPPTIQKSVKFRDFVEKYVRSLLTYYIQTWWVFLTKPLFPEVSMDIR